MFENINENFPDKLMMWMIDWVALFTSFVNFVCSPIKLKFEIKPKICSTKLFPKV